MSLNVLGLVPARGGSARIADKNLAKIGGRSLVRRALETTAAASRVGAVALSSDDDRILAEGSAVDSVLLIRRPPALATPTATSVSAVEHALAEVELRGGGPFDAVALVQCTSPFTRPGDINGAIETMERTGSGSVFSVGPLHHAFHPVKARLLVGDRLIPYGEVEGLLAAHELPDLWINNGSVYLSHRRTIAAGLLASGDLRAYPMPAERSLDVNSWLDLEFARFLAERP